MPAGVVAALLWIGLLASAARAQEVGATEAVVVQTGAGVVELSLEVADDGAERARGLMFRRSLPDKGGMLFDFGAEQPVYMWMRNTYLPLDMLFLDGDGRIVHIARETKPLSEDTITAGRPVRGVIEIAGGKAAKLGIAVGDLVSRRLFAPES
jgi:uncharacterized membrane protein (UPF0127 family)